MRMWYVLPQVLCTQHLLGEHCEMHMFLGSLKKSIPLHTYASTNLFAGQFLLARHDVLARELTERKRNHLSPMPYLYVPDEYRSHPNFEASLAELLTRCPYCTSRYQWLLRYTILDRTQIGSWWLKYSNYRVPAELDDPRFLWRPK